jgi:hypothetical protein
MELLSRLQAPRHHYPGPQLARDGTVIGRCMRIWHGCPAGAARIAAWSNNDDSRDGMHCGPKNVHATRPCSPARDSW